ncbi:MAG: hypothetical protein PHV13_00760 [Candidatus ainarchaeum sp.]|nr:hypothetical protein [Candidatus ainarchaeum sp.]
MRGKTITKMRIRPETILQKVKDGHGHKTAFGRTTYRALLEGLLHSGTLAQDVVHKALWKGATAGRAKIVLEEVRKGNYAFPNTGTCESTTYGQELLEHVGANRIAMHDALSAIRDGRSNRMAWLLDQVESGLHDDLNQAGLTYQQELLGFVKGGFLTATMAASAVRIGYLRRVQDALAQVACGHCAHLSRSGLSYREELDYLVRLGFVKPDAAHDALLAGHRIVLGRRKQESLDITLAVREGRFAHPAGPFSNDRITFGEKLKELVADGVVDEETAHLAFMEGRARIVEECTRRSHHILDGVARGKSDVASFSYLTFGEELSLLVESGAITKERAEEAKSAGATIKARRDRIL